VTAAAALVLAGALAVYPLLDAGGGAALVAIAAALGFAFVVVALLAMWEDGLVAGPGLLLAACALSLAFGEPALDRRAPLVGMGLLGLVELGSWSLELRDGAEEHPLARLSSVFLLLVAALAASTLVLAVGGARAGAGLALWVFGATAALALLALITHAARTVLRESDGDARLATLSARDRDPIVPQHPRL
jgi:hypothetical protein